MADTEGEQPVPIDEGCFADVRGAPQWITLRGADAGQPALLMLFGPGASFTRMAPFFAPWEADFTLVQWDQPGGGATFARNGEVALSLDRLAADAAAVAEIALRRLGAAKLVVLGVSGGSIVGLKLAQGAARSGGGVRRDRSDRPLAAPAGATATLWRWTRRGPRGDAAAVAALEAVGPPPYADVAVEMAFSKHANALTPAEQSAFASLDPATTAALAAPPPGARYVPQDLALPEPRKRARARSRA